jgi:hypothetical protein
VIDSETRLRAPANRVSRRAKTYWTVRALAGWIVVGAVETFICIGTSGPWRSRT